MRTTSQESMPQSTSRHRTVEHFNLAASGAVSLSIIPASLRQRRRGGYRFTRFPSRHSTYSWVVQRRAGDSQDGTRKRLLEQKEVRHGKRYTLDNISPPPAGGLRAATQQEGVKHGSLDYGSDSSKPKPWDSFTSLGPSPDLINTSSVLLDEKRCGSLRHRQGCRTFQNLAPNSICALIFDTRPFLAIAMDS
ncbi:hypothetical protein DPEC_G00155270 [Dallia pectoralis]|uniref:Uncharacterized protein n=1 Tax=Dallia pectoralis TaxID=75939 RepID=A0ACC2GKX3_DALPE|nr:hypothetical protein DPEC_G00155270 [Dallia pectoralis]